MTNEEKLRSNDSEFASTQGFRWNCTICSVGGSWVDTQKSMQAEYIKHYNLKHS